LISQTIENYYDLSKASHQACGLQLIKIRKKEPAEKIKQRDEIESQINDKMMASLQELKDI